MKLLTYSSLLLVSSAFAQNPAGTYKLEHKERSCYTLTLKSGGKAEKKFENYVSGFKETQKGEWIAKKDTLVISMFSNDGAKESRTFIYNDTCIMTREGNCLYKKKK